MVSENPFSSPQTAYLRGERLRQFGLHERLTPLSAVEQNRLEFCEQIIARGLRTFVEVGQALFEIRKFRLYRAEFSTFEAYCKDRWQLKRQRAYELMEAAEVVRQLSEVSDNPLPLKESHAASLMKLPAEQRREVWADIVSQSQTSNQPITARIIQEKIEELRLDRPAPVAFDNEPVTPRDVLLSRVREAFDLAGPRDVMVQVSGNWLIRNGLTEIWKRLRNIDKKMVITDKYKDYLTIEQARQLGLVQRM